MEDALVLPYARAALAVAEKDGGAEAWDKALAALAYAMGQPAAAGRIRHPASTDQEKVQFLLQLLDGEGGKIRQQLARLLQEMALHGRLQLLPSLHLVFARLRDQASGTSAVEVQTAAALGAEERKKVEATLKKRLEGQLRFHYATDPALVGGFLARCGDRVLDASLRGRLARLRRRLTA